MTDPHTIRLTRRRLLTATGALTTAAAITATLPATSPAYADSRQPLHQRAWTAPRSENQWPVAKPTAVTTLRVEGSDATVALLHPATGASDATTVLLHIVRRFHYEIATLTNGDIHGHTTNRTITADYESNHLSATAIAIKPDAYPPGTTGNLYPHQIATIHDIITNDCENVVQWNGTHPLRPAEGHFHITTPPNDPHLTKVAAKIRAWNNQPGQGAGQ